MIIISASYYMVTCKPLRVAHCNIIMLSCVPRLYWHWRTCAEASLCVFQLAKEPKLHGRILQLLAIYLLSLNCIKLESSPISMDVGNYIYVCLVSLINYCNFHINWFIEKNINTRIKNVKNVGIADQQKA